MLIPLAQIGDQKGLGGAVECGQRFIEQQGTRFGDESAGQSDALTFTSRDLRGAAFAQVVDAEGSEHFAGASLTLRGARGAKSVGDVFFGAEMREQRKILMNVADAALPGSDVLLFLRIVESFAANGDAAFVGRGESGDAIEQCGFARTRRAENYCETGQRAQMNIQNEAALGIGEALADADFEFGGDRLGEYGLCGLDRKGNFQRHGPTAQGRRLVLYRFNPKTIDRTRNETTNSSRAVWFALE